MFVPLQFNKGNLQRLIVNLTTGIVNSWSAGSTGLTPAAATGGAVVLGGVLNVANGGTGVTTSTGSGSVVLNTSAQLVTPDIGVATGTSVSLTGFALIGRGLNPTVGGSTSTVYQYFNATAIGIYTGTGSPTISTARGSLYLRSDGVPYYNTNGTTGWSVLTGGTGPTVQNLTSGSGATYTTPAGVKWIKVRMVGGGGGGGGAGGTTGPTGGTGGNTIFNGINAAGGIGGGGAVPATNSPGGAGGTGGAGTATLRVVGNGGSTAGSNAAAADIQAGGGAGSVFGGAVTGAMAQGATGTSAAANTGAGGSGGGGTVGALASGSGGGSGEYVELIINNPGATYLYTIGAVGAGGIGTGANAVTGGAGGTGFITVDEHYSFG